VENESIIFIGMDTHKESSDVAYALEGRDNVPVHFGKIKSTKTAVQKMARHFQSKFPRATLHFCYEAGPCGDCERDDRLYLVNIERSGIACNTSK